MKPMPVTGLLKERKKGREEEREGGRKERRRKKKRKSFLHLCETITNTGQCIFNNSVLNIQNDLQDMVANTSCILNLHFFEFL